VNEQKLRKLIKSGEDIHTEFKREIDDASDIAAEIVSFANSEGGMLLIGVDDDGTIYGLDEPEIAERRLMGIVRGDCRPAPTVLPETVPIEGKTVLALKVEKGQDKPYCTGRDHYYVRVGSTKRRATKEELYRLFQAAGFVHYDQVGVPGTSIEDIDLLRVEQYFRDVHGLELEEERQVVSLEKLLVNSGIMTSVENNILATVGGILIFGKSPESVLYASGILAVRYRGTEIGDLLDRRDLSGVIPQLIEDAISFVRVHNITPAEIQGAKREDKPRFPGFAVREAIVNALAHRNYSITGSKIRLLIFDNRIEVHSPGRLPNTVNLENIRLGGSFHRNQFIVRMLNNYRYMERIGLGIPKMIKVCKEFSGKEPIFEERGEEFVVTIPARLKN